MLSISSFSQELRSPENPVRFSAPRYLRSDNGPEFVSRAILKWAAENGMDLALSDPSKPWQNGADESFPPATSSMARRSQLRQTLCGPRAESFESHRRQIRTCLAFRRNPTSLPI
jgi:transposase InsO family protein